MDFKESNEIFADIYSIIVAIEGLEKAFIKDALMLEEYTAACSKLIAQFKTGASLLGANFKLEKFVRDYQLSCPAAVRRIEIGVPATVEHSVIK